MGLLLSRRHDERQNPRQPVEMITNVAEYNDCRSEICRIVEPSTSVTCYISTAILSPTSITRKDP